MPTKRFTEAQLASKVKNPKTGRTVPFGSIVTAYGRVKAKYAKYLFLTKTDDILRIKTVIAVNNSTNEVIKIDFNATTLAQPFKNVDPKKIKVGKELFNYKIVSEIPRDMGVEVAFTLSFTYTFSSKPNEETPVEFTINGFYSPEQLSNTEFLVDLITENSNVEPNPSLPNMGYSNIRVKNILTKNKKELELDDMVLRDSKPLDITNIYNEKIELLDGNCVHEFLKKNYPKHTKSSKQMEKIREINTTNDIYDFCVKYRIKMVAYDISRNVIKANYPTKKAKLKNCIFLAYNNHLYPIRNPTLLKSNVRNQLVRIIDNVEESLIKLLQSGTIPRYVNMNKTEKSYYSVLEEIDGVKTEVVYSGNKEYNRCVEILEKFGLKDKAYPSITVKSLGRIIEDLYAYREVGGGRIKISTNSFMPYGKKITKEGYRFKNEECEMDDSFVTLDINKAYPNELYNLDYLPKIDVKVNEPYKIENQDHIITPHYKYVVSVECRTILLENNGEYFGNILLLARQNNIKFKLLEEMEVSIEPNYFKRMINDLKVKTTNEEFKNIMNILIGKLEYKTEEYTTFKYVKVMKEDEKKMFSGYTENLNDEFSVGYNKVDKYMTTTRKPIADLIKDNVRIRLFNFIKELKLKQEDIKQIKTDAITFRPKSQKYKDYIKDELGDWKVEDFNEITSPIITPKEIPSFFYPHSGSGKLITGYAGCGKTYDITNNIIPNLEKTYRVLTPSHKALEEYRKANYTCDVIQKYTASNKLPEEEVIIIDEVGMLDAMMWNVLYKCKIAGKEIIAYGDFRQLPPVNSNLRTYDTPNFLNMMFREQITNDNNYRNDFTQEYYDNLRNTFSRKKREEEVRKHNTDWKTAETIIAYTNATRTLYNEKMCNHLGIENITDSGTKVICKTNEFRQYEIYNNFQFIVKEIDDEDIILETFNGNEYTLPLKKYLKKNAFQYGYCLTLYATQGSSLSSFHYAEEDIKWLCPRAVYTLISRLKK